jgi:hypothetical protein
LNGADKLSKFIPREKDINGVCRPVACHIRHYFDAVDSPARQRSFALLIDTMTVITFTLIATLCFGSSWSQNAPFDRKLQFLQSGLNPLFWNEWPNNITSNWNVSSVSSSCSSDLSTIKRSLSEGHLWAHERLLFFFGF